MFLHVKDEQITCTNATVIESEIDDDEYDRNILHIFG